MGWPASTTGSMRKRSKRKDVADPLGDSRGGLAVEELPRHQGGGQLLVGRQILHRSFRGTLAGGDQGDDLQVRQVGVRGEVDVRPVQRAAEVEGDVESLDLGLRHQVDHRVDPVGIVEGEEAPLHLVLVVVEDQGAARIDARRGRRSPAGPGCHCTVRSSLPAGWRRCCGRAGRLGPWMARLSWVVAWKSSVSASSSRWRWKSAADESQQVRPARPPRRGARSRRTSPRISRPSSPWRPARGRRRRG